jgi:hypothetical protein
MNKKVFVAFIRNDEAETLLFAKPFHCTLCHLNLHSEPLS